MSIFSKFAHWNDYTEEAQRETLKDVDRWLEDYDRLKEENKNLLEACKYALRIFEKYKNHPQMESVREALRKVIKESEVV